MDARLDNREPVDGHRQDRDAAVSAAFAHDPGGNPEPSRPALLPQTKTGKRLLTVILDATGPSFDLLLHGLTPADAILAIEDEARERAAGGAPPSPQTPSLDRDELIEAIHDATPPEEDGGVPDVCNRWHAHAAIADRVLALLAAKLRESGAAR